MNRTATMTHDEAAAILTEATAHVGGMTELSTVPTAEQQAAIRSIDPSQPAPLEVCDEWGVDSGSTWGAVLREIAFDVGTTVDEAVELGRAHDLIHANGFTDAPGADPDDPNHDHRPAA